MLRDDGEAVIEKSVPVPLKATVCGLPAALSVIARIADRDPEPLGVKTTLMLQLPAGASDDPQLLIWLKSALFAPAIVIPEIVKTALPLLVSVTFWAAPAVLTG